jgi:hypothetical protein
MIPFALINGDMGLATFAVCHGIDDEFKLSVELIRMVDWLANVLSDAFFCFLFLKN